MANQNVQSGPADGLQEKLVAVRRVAKVVKGVAFSASRH